MKIYTRTGDVGETSLAGGERVGKDHVRVRAYGDLDELNASLGAVHSRLASWHDLRDEIEQIQKELFGIGGEVASSGKALDNYSKWRVEDEAVKRLEDSIDAKEAELPALKHFILPGGGTAGSALHVARTVCRRAERSLIALHGREATRAEIMRYLNRLSDWLFVVARYVNHRERHEEVPW